jgi:release factor glutamine methyltransferase
MTYGEWLNIASKEFAAIGIESARLDSLMLLEFVTNTNRAYILANPENPLQGQSLQRLNKLLERRKNREPIAYIIGKKEFYGRQFIVNKKVLVPRPESEDFINLLKDILCNKTSFSEVRNLEKKRLIDVGTGSGCLAITAKLEFPDIEVFGSDKSESALSVANSNSKNLDAEVTFKKSDLLSNEPVGSIDIIFANLPYVPFDYIVSKEVISEPSEAVFANKNGLDLIFNLAPQAHKTLKHNGILFIESLPEQQLIIKNLYKKSGFKFINKAGLVQVFLKSN